MTHPDTLQRAAFEAWYDNDPSNTSLKGAFHAGYRAALTLVTGPMRLSPVFPIEDNIQANAKITLFTWLNRQSKPSWKSVDCGSSSSNTISEFSTA